MKDVELFRNGSVHDFYRLKALITLEQVITSVVEKEKNLKEQNFHGETNWSGVVNFYCMQMSLVMSMRFIFGNEMTCHVYHVFDVISLDMRGLGRFRNSQQAFAQALKSLGHLPPLRLGI